MAHPTHSEGREKRKYYQIIRTAAALTGLRVWYIRRLTHATTSALGEKLDDVPHFSVYADKSVDEPSGEDYDFEGHIYTLNDEKGDPIRLLHYEGFEYQAAEDPAPIWLWSTHDNEDVFKVHPDDTYYDEIEGIGQEHRWEDWEGAEGGASGDVAEGPAGGAGPEKTKRKRRRRKGKKP
ncbi:hypothetical protein VTK73DRAFT_1782 [Phialemonium thermophilum]|uniref:Uncharacterized protein n=1 Tax=Phialemonium thermophilum TaxID=223376 RepID=A0ABR3X8R6_9PEZI